MIPQFNLTIFSLNKIEDCSPTNGGWPTQRVIFLLFVLSCKCIIHDIYKNDNIVKKDCMQYISIYMKIHRKFKYTFSDLVERHDFWPRHYSIPLFSSFLKKKKRRMNSKIVIKSHAFLLDQIFRDVYSIGA